MKQHKITHVDGTSETVRAACYHTRAYWFVFEDESGKEVHRVRGADVRSIGLVDEAARPGFA